METVRISSYSSLRVLCAFAVSLSLPSSNQNRAKRGFLAKAPSSQRLVPNEEWYVVLLVWLRSSERCIRGEYFLA